MKTISGAMRTHLDGVVTSLSSLWHITRVDGVEFFFTDHDRNIVFGGDTYLSTLGYSRTAISNNASLAVDNLDVEGVLGTEFQSDVLKADELRAGLFDGAEVTIGLISWEDTTHGIIKMRRGKFGEVMLNHHGTFKAELRGLAQAYTQQIIELYQSECRTDLGSRDGCHMPMNPDLIERGEAYTLFVEGQEGVGGDFKGFYKVPTGAATGVTIANCLNNASFEVDGPEADVTTISGWTVLSGTVSVVTSREGLTPDEGSHFLVGPDTSSTSVVEQSVRIDRLFSTDRIDAGNVSATFNIRRASSAGTDTASVRFDWLDGDGEIISSPLATSMEVIAPQDTWVDRGFGPSVIPVGARYALITLRMTTAAGDGSQAFDDAVLSLEDATAPNSFYEIYENRIYEIVTPGTTAAVAPTFDTTVGNTTSDDGSVAASALLTFSSQPANNATVTIGSRVYTYKTTLTGAANEVLRGANATASRDNLVHAILDDSGEGTLYGTGTLVHADVSAVATGANMTATALVAGTAGNLIAVAETSGGLAWSGSFLAGGLDGAEWEAHQAWTRHAVVKDVIDRKNFTITYDESRAVDGWFSEGGLVFETGPNSGRTIEVKEWTQSTALVELMFAAKFAVVPGQKLRIWPGCLKLPDSCIAFDNILNYQGEPFIPGNDLLLRTPDAK